MYVCRLLRIQFTWKHIPRIANLPPLSFAVTCRLERSPRRPEELHVPWKLRGTIACERARFGSVYRCAGAGAGARGAGQGGRSRTPRCAERYLSISALSPQRLPGRQPQVQPVRASLFQAAPPTSLRARRTPHPVPHYSIEGERRSQTAQANSQRAILLGRAGIRKVQGVQYRGLGLISIAWGIPIGPLGFPTT